jgi:hypothetical protein
VRKRALLRSGRAVLLILILLGVLISGGDAACPAALASLRRAWRSRRAPTLFAAGPGG